MDTKEGLEALLEMGKKAFYYGFIPVVVYLGALVLRKGRRAGNAEFFGYLGMTRTSPAPTLLQYAASMSSMLKTNMAF